MNCDQAFERLTDVAALPDACLDEHLAQCPRCRAMQQTLSPALDWLTLASTENFSASSPDWNGTHSPLLSEASVAVAADIARRLPRLGYAQTTRKALGIALVALFGMAFGAFAIGQPPKPAPTAAVNSSSVPVTACLWPQRGTERAGNAQTIIDSCVACHVPTMLRN